MESALTHENAIPRADAPREERDTSLAGLLSRNRAGLMGIAILLVMACHAEFRIPIWRILYPLYTVQRLLYGGVDIFFFLSGFGVCRSLDRNPDAAAFFGRRLRRVYPIYLPLAVLWVIAWSVLTPPLPFNSVMGVLTGLGFWMQLPYQFMWFVPAILVFYLLSPCMHAFLTRRRNLHLAFAILLALSVALALPTFYTWQILASSRLPVYIAGMYFSLAFRKERRGNILFELAAYAIMVGGFYVIIHMPEWVADWDMYYCGLFNYPFLLIVPGFCLLLARLADLVRRCFLRPVVRFCERLGRCSLELCLIHFLVFQVMRELIEFNNWIRLLLMAVSILLSIGYAALLHKLTARGGGGGAPAACGPSEAGEMPPAEATAASAPVE